MNDILTSNRLEWIVLHRQICLVTKGIRSPFCFQFKTKYWCKFDRLTVNNDVTGTLNKTLFLPPPVTVHQHNMVSTVHRRSFKNVFRPKRARVYNPSAKGISKELKDGHQRGRRQKERPQAKKRWHPGSTCLFMMQLICSSSIERNTLLSVWESCWGCFTPQKGIFSTCQGGATRRRDSSKSNSYRSKSTPSNEDWNQCSSRLAANERTFVDWCFSNGVLQPFVGHR